MMDWLPLEWKEAVGQIPSSAGFLALAVALLFDEVRKTIGKYLTKFRENVIGYSLPFFMTTAIVAAIAVYRHGWPGAVGLAGLAAFVGLKWLKPAFFDAKIWLLRMEYVFLLGIIFLFLACNAGDFAWQVHVYERLKGTSTIAVVTSREPDIQSSVPKVHKYLKAAFADLPDAVQVLPNNAVSSADIRTVLEDLAPSPTAKEALMQFGWYFKMPVELEVLVSISRSGDRNYIMQIDRYALGKGARLEGLTERTFNSRGLSAIDPDLLALLASAEVIDFMLDTHRAKPTAIDQRTVWRTLGTDLAEAVIEEPPAELPNDPLVRDIHNRRRTCGDSACVHRLVALFQSAGSVAETGTDDIEGANTFAAALRAAKPVAVRVAEPAAKGGDL